MSYLKKHFLIYFIICLSPLFLVAQTTSIPDLNFENYLETHDANANIVAIGDASSMGDGIANNNLVLNARIQDVTSLNVSYQNISNLTGVEGFSSLETLICSNNDIANLNVSALTNLKSLLCGLNQLTTLDIQSNDNLEVLDCSSNQLTNLLLQQGNVANNPLLRRLTCSNNKLSDLDISQNIELTFLAVSENQFSGEFNLGNNLNLESFFCASNQISILNLSNNTVLKNLDASNNSITNLNLSTVNTQVCPDPQTNPLTLCQGVASINVSRNELASLIINNGFNDLITALNSEDNPDLFCIQIDAGFSPSTNWTKDDWTYYAETTCTDDFTYVPDDNFEVYLEINGLGDDIANNDFVLTDRIKDILTLNIPNENIDDLTGIEDFIALQNLNCSNNNLIEINLSNNSDLLDINCSNNPFSILDFSNNIALTTINCSVTTLNTIDVTANNNLVSLNVANNALTSLNVSNNLFLSDLDCSFNQIESLNTSVNAALTSFICNDNNLLGLNIKNGQNPNLTNFDAQNNTDLICIETDTGGVPAGVTWAKDPIASYNANCGTYVPDNAFENYLEVNGLGDGVVNNNFVSTGLVNMFAGSLDISGLGIFDLTGIEAFFALQNLNCSNNSLTNLDLSNSTDLITLDCSFNQIENIDFTLNLDLVSLLCNNNALLTLNIRNGSNGALTNFDARNNSSLFCINTDNAIVGTNPTGWQKDNIASYNIDCSGSRFTPIPDNNFEQALIDLGIDSGGLDNQVLTANIEHLLTLNVNDKQISSLVGIKDFKLLQELDCSNNYLNDLDVSDMINLEELYCSSNYFLTNNTANTIGLLNTSGTISLTKLFCISNNLSDLDTSININLEELDCADNNIDILTITGNTQLKELNCSNNNLTGIDLSTNAALEEVNCNSNNISNLTTVVTNNTTLTKLSCDNNELATLLVDNYVGLKYLSCRSNALNQLNITSNINLEILDFSDNMIDDEDIVVNNINLISLSASQNQLTQLNLNTNAFLESLNCSNNQITQLVVNSGAQLKYLSCNNNQLTDLDVSNNFNLIELIVSTNTLSNLVLSNNLSQLKTFNCSNNQLPEGVDLSTMGTGACPTTDDLCPDIITINVSNNQLEFLNIQNGVNNNISAFNASNNPYLSCIQVDDINAIGSNWQKDVIAEYGIDCRFGETYVPDDNFEQALINLGYDTAPLNDYVPTIIIETLEILDVSNNNISDLTGIEDFEGLTDLNCSNNALSNIDLTNNLDLTEVDCSSNGFTDIDFSSNTLLQIINCSNNTINSLDLTQNTSLVNLNIANNLFTAFDTGLIPTLEVFNCDINQIIDLNLSANSALTDLSCASNRLLTLNIQNGQNPALINLSAENNEDLTCIQTDSGVAPGGVNWVKDATAEYAIDCHYGETYVPDDEFENALINLGYDTVLDDYVLTFNIENLSFLDIGGNNISDLTGIQDFESITTLRIDENLLTDLDLSSNVLIENLEASNNLLTMVALSSNVNLKSLNVSSNTLAQLDVSSNLKLQDLIVSNNLLTSLEVNLLEDLESLDGSSNLLDALDVSSNPKLVDLFCQSNNFTQDKLNLQNGANSTLDRFNATNNPNLACILVDNPAAVISNTDGNYDNWYKDNTANYQSVCDDADNDGVANGDDACPGTPLGEPVDLFGCPYSVLPEDNFTILITGETCLNNNDGKINILSYTVSFCFICF